MRFVLTAFCILLLSSSANAGDAPPVRTESLAWMAGSWESTAGGIETEESWLAPKGGLMLGVSRTTRANAASAFEFLRINNTKEGVSYYAQPGGKPATAFKLVKLKGQSVVFENAEHDFPQRILYRREGDVLHARIEGTINGKERAKDWEFRKVEKGDGK